MSFKDWIQFIINRIVWVLETPKEENKALKLRSKERWMSRWFGLVPYSIHMTIKRVRRKFH
jgi:hypothetical protein